MASRQFGYRWLPLDAAHILDLNAAAPQTANMAHIYLVFDFASDEEKAQLARHKLETWKQAFRLDKRLVYKFERIEPEAEADRVRGAGKRRRLAREKLLGRRRGVRMLQRRQRLGMKRAGRRRIGR